MITSPPEWSDGDKPEGASELKEKNPPRGSEEISWQNYQKRKEEEEEEEELVPAFHLRPRGLGIRMSPWSQKCPEPRSENNLTS